MENLPNYQKSMHRSWKIVLLGILTLVTFASSQSTMDTDLDRFCEACIVNTGAGYYSHPLRCDVFVHCSQSGDNRTVMASVKECPNGLYWSQEDLTCRHPYDVYCPQDPCKQPGRIAYREVFSCAAYYKCKNGTRESQRTCCEDRYRFDEISQKCVEDKLCRSNCHNKITLVSDSPPLIPLCTKKAALDDVRFYIQDVHGYNYRMPCPLGTIFSLDACSCIRGRRNITNIIKRCEPFIHLPFDKDWKDYSKYPKGTGARSVTILPIEGASGSSAAFFNDSSVTVWALNNMFFGSNFTLSFRFRPVEKTNGRFALVDNSDCDKSATFGVAYERTETSRTIYGGFILNDESVVRLQANLKPDQWHSVTLLKTGFRVELWVDGLKTSKSGSADIKRLDCSLTIGRGTNLDPFIGFIDDLQFFKCTPEEYL
ncbi:uncharacterized protein LOC115219174 [Octopus sinensis]|uniref:Uncharacterized protein LOC115219174 n=1 Tax=Octopus sinensis TaxID=2607531 RepID=A0A6P7T4D3_9MOLL|nr:uncharacterized protein LOC115219174 [Octopus sinensis]